MIVWFSLKITFSSYFQNIEKKRTKGFSQKTFFCFYIFTALNLNTGPLSTFITSQSHIPSCNSITEDKSPRSK